MKCEHEGCERDTESQKNQWCSAHAIRCVWCLAIFERRESYPYDCPKCGVTLTESHANYCETWAELALRKGRPVPEGRNPSDYVNRTYSALLGRGLKSAEKYIRWLSALESTGPSGRSADDRLAIEHVATTIDVLMDVFNIRPIAADQRDVWFSAGKRAITELANAEAQWASDSATLHGIIDQRTKERDDLREQVRVLTNVVNRPSPRFLDGDDE